MFNVFKTFIITISRNSGSICNIKARLKKKTLSNCSQNPVKETQLIYETQADF